MTLGRRQEEAEAEMGPMGPQAKKRHDPNPAEAGRTNPWALTPMADFRPSGLGQGGSVVGAPHVWFLFAAAPARCTLSWQLLLVTPQRGHTCRGIEGPLGARPSVVAPGTTGCGRQLPASGGLGEGRTGRGHTPRALTVARPSHPFRVWVQAQEVSCAGSQPGANAGTLVAEAIAAVTELAVC